MQNVVTGMTLSTEQFRALPETNAVIVDHIRGVVYVDSPVDPHQEVVLNTALLLRTLAPHGKTRVAPMDVYLGDDTVQPDVFWVGAESACSRTPDNHWQGPPDLVCEVLSRSTARNDRPGGAKFKLYQQHGIREYWIIDPIYQSVEVYVGFESRGEFWPGQHFHSPILDADIDVNRIFEE